MYNPSNVFILIGSVGKPEEFTIEQIRHYCVVAKDANTAVALVTTKYPDFNVATASNLEALNELKQTLDAIADKSEEPHFIDPDLQAVF